MKELKIIFTTLIVVLFFLGCKKPDHLKCVIEYEGDYTAILECDNRNEIWEAFIGRDILSDQMDIFLKNFSFNGTISARVKDDCSFIILASDEFISPSGETISIASGTGNSEGENLLINLNTSFDSNCVLKLVKK